MRDAILKYIKQGPIQKFIAGFSFLFVTGALATLVIAYPVKTAYYAFANGNYFLNVTDVTVTEEITEDEDAALVICREPRVRVVAFDNIRTYYRSADESQAFQRNLPDGICYEIVTGKHQ